MTLINERLGYDRNVVEPSSILVNLTFPIVHSDNNALLSRMMFLTGFFLYIYFLQAYELVQGKLVSFSYSKICYLIFLQLWNR